MTGARRLAYFSPLRPLKTGVAEYSEISLNLLHGHFDVDVYINRGYEPDIRNLPGGISIRRYDRFFWENLKSAYDLNVYQMGNEACHGYMYGFIFRYPGLTVLHDGCLHQSRGLYLLNKGRIEDYKAEAEYCHGERGRRMSHQVLEGRPSELMYNFFPMRKTVLDNSRAAAVHSRYLEDKLKTEYPSLLVRRLPMPVKSEDCSEQAVEQARKQLDLAGYDMVFVFPGLLTLARGTETVFKALQRLKQEDFKFLCLLAGQPSPSYDLEDKINEYNLSPWVRVMGYVPDATFKSVMQAGDIIFNFRFPTGRETSAVLLQSMGAGKCVMTYDLLQNRDIPNSACLKIKPGPAEIDQIVNTILSLRRSPDRIKKIGRNAREYVENEHYPEMYRDRLMDLIKEAMEIPCRPYNLSVEDQSELPPHLQDIKKGVNTSLAKEIHDLGIDRAGEDYLNIMGKKLRELNLD